LRALWATLSRFARACARISNRLQGINIIGKFDGISMARTYKSQADFALRIAAPESSCRSYSMVSRRSLVWTAQNPPPIQGLRTGLRMGVVSVKASLMPGQ